ncbi:MAG: endonuclease [Candidatus Saganbacteria bacterium]|uniref:UPF0102 protein FD145_541 n=1 Tax=Candidatus Saganbacteria bacterium TaxID=2575572 RepID=A0A833NYR8_UNCSA|nr:MAG: endonuclease [Candidatus Saganbacteria bacterium]
MGKESFQIGITGEIIAVEYLTQKGLSVIDRNFHSQQGEIDIIAKDGDIIVFVEVKYYSFRSYGSPLGSVRKSKRQSIIHAAQTFLYKKNLRQINCRFDVISIYRDSGGKTNIDYIKDAFYVN